MNAGSSCAVGEVVTGFDTSGKMVCAKPGAAGVSCSAGQVLNGIKGDGTPNCITPKPSAAASCAAGQAVKGFKADGSLNCIATTPPGPCPSTTLRFTMTTEKVRLSYHWPGGTKTQSLVAPNSGCSVTVDQPSGGIDVPGSRLVGGWKIVSFKGFTSATGVVKQPDCKSRWAFDTSGTPPRFDRPSCSSAALDTALTPGAPSTDTYVVTAVGHGGSSTGSGSTGSGSTDAGAPVAAALALVKSTLAEGAAGQAVLLLQKQLALLGYLKGTPTGTYGKDTLAAVLAFQAASGLTKDSTAGTATLGALLAAVTKAVADAQAAEKAAAAQLVQKQLLAQAAQKAAAAALARQQAAATVLAQLTATWQAKRAAATQAAKEKQAAVLATLSAALEQAQQQSADADAAQKAAAAALVKAQTASQALAKQAAAATGG